MKAAEKCEHPSTTLDERREWVVCIVCGAPVKCNPSTEPPVGYCDTRDYRRS